MEAIIELLQNKLKQKGLVYLSQDSMSFYKDLEKYSKDAYLNRLVLITFMAGVVPEVKKAESTLETTTDFIMKNCAMNKKEAKRIAGVWHTVLSNEKIMMLRKRENQGFKEFCKINEFSFSFELNAIWDAGNTYMDLTYEALVKVEIQNKENLKRALQPILSQSPYITSDEIRKLLEEKMAGEANASFEEYCSWDDYYPPVADDYGDNLISDVVKPFCKKYGLKFLDLEGEGSGDDEYIPKGRW